MQVCKNKKKKKWVKFLVAVILIAIFVECYFNLFVNPQIVKSNISTIKSVTIETLNSAISNTIAQNDYDTLVSITKDSNGKIVLMQVNSKNANKLNSDIISAAQEKLNAQKCLSYSIPLGTFTGLPILNGLGPNINVKIVPIGSVNTKFNSQITSLGINQSYHKIFISINITVCVLLPLYTQNITVSNQVLVAESLILGEIPNVYLNTDNLTNALNLIP